MPLAKIETSSYKNVQMFDQFFFKIPEKFLKNCISLGRPWNNFGLLRQLFSSLLPIERQVADKTHVTHDYEVIIVAFAFKSSLLQEVKRLWEIKCAEIVGFYYGRFVFGQMHRFSISFYYSLLNYCLDTIWIVNNILLCAKIIKIMRYI